MIKERVIIYEPDFVIDAVGLINVYYELLNQPKEKVQADLKLIYDRLIEIFEIADHENINTQLAAKVFAKKRIETIKNLHDNYIPR